MVLGNQVSRAASRITTLAIVIFIPSNAVRSLASGHAGLERDASRSSCRCRQMLLLALRPQRAVPAVDPQAAARDEAGMLRAQEQDGIGRLVERALATEHVQAIGERRVAILDLLRC